ncbi:MAG: methyltransferase domain-containing protein [Actinobacteria bacterium]|nr:MAG: methyltransferase domain-containing protein [Actinomycetota bacterium]
MAAPAACPICDGQLSLLHAGTARELAARSLSPTNHRTGEHGDLYRCRECGTVHQPSLPRGPELADLYRAMHDDAYLEEEPGRRRTAQRLLDMIGRFSPAGRLLDVGCGHGLLLDVARARGYEVEGLELSAASAAYAREVLGLTVHERTLDEHEPEEGYAAILLADVLEHLDDPVGAIRRCHDLLRPGGVVCVVTPDPGSLTARLAGSRWWALLPAHTFLIPRRTLREILTGEGLLISDDLAFVRSFSLRYWLEGLAQRGGSLAAAIRALQRAIPRRLTLSLSLGDERVLLAHRAELLRSPHPLASPRGREREVHAVLPAYEAASTIPQVAEEMPGEAVDRALLVDDASSDQTTAVALQHGFDVITHPRNRGYGANQKTCYSRSVLDGADVVVMVHADNQYDPALVREMVEPIERGEADVVIGSRLLEDETIAGGMPRWKWLGNRALTWVENRAFRRRYSEYHTGYRAFSAEFLRSVPFGRNSDGFVFDQEMFAQIVARGARVVELPIPTRYFLEASSVSFSASVEYGLRTLVVLARYRLDEQRRLRWPLLRRPAARLSSPARSGADRA